MDEAEQALRGLDPLRLRAVRHITHQRSPRGGRLRHVVEGTRMGDLDEPVFLRPRDTGDMQDGRAGYRSPRRWPSSNETRLSVWAARRYAGLDRGSGYEFTSIGGGRFCIDPVLLDPASDRHRRVRRAEPPQVPTSTHVTAPTSRGFADEYSAR